MAFAKKSSKKVSKKVVSKAPVVTEEDRRAGIQTKMRQTEAANTTRKVELQKGP